MKILSFQLRIVVATICLCHAQALAPNSLALGRPSTRVCSPVHQLRPPCYRKRGFQLKQLSMDDAGEIDQTDETGESGAKSNNEAGNSDEEDKGQDKTITEDGNEDESEMVEVAVAEETDEEETTLMFRIKRMLRRGKKEHDGLTFKQRLAKMGLSVALSYGWVSNMSYSVTVSLAWYIFSKRTGLSPLAPGQWKPFLAVYAGFYVFNNFIRPARLALSAGVSRYFDDAVNYIERKTKVSRALAIGILVFLANFCGTLVAMSFGIFLASAAAGVPVFPPKA